MSNQKNQILQVTKVTTKSWKQYSLIEGGKCESALERRVMKGINKQIPYTLKADI